MVRTAIAFGARGSRFALQGQTSGIETVDAPTFGWVVSENLADLPDKAAAQLDNWYPEPDSIRLRPGSSNHADLPREWTPGSESPASRGFWQDGETAYVVDVTEDAVFAYNLYTGERDESKEFDLASANADPRGIWSDGTTLYCCDTADARIYAYTLSTGAQDVSKEFDLDAVSTNPLDIWSDGTTLWVVNSDVTDTLHAYTLATGARDGGQDVTLDAVNANPYGVWSDGTTVWVSDLTDAILYAYVLSTGVRDGGKDITCDGDNTLPAGMSGDATGVGLLWVQDFTTRTVFVYGITSASNIEGSGAVDTVFAYQSGSQTNLFAAQDGKIYDVTEREVHLSWAGQTTDEYNYTMMGTAAGQFLMVANGSEHPVNFDGTDFTQSPTITGITPSDITVPIAYAQRLFFLLKDSAQLAYLDDVSSIGGAASTLEVGPYLRFGGSLVAGTTWTIDAGFGPDDYLVVISSEGEVVVFQGTDPSSSTTWSQVGKFFVGRPIGSHCLLNIGVDVIALTSDGLISLARSFQTDRTASDRTAFTDRIEKAFNEAFRSVGALQGWQIITYPRLNMAIVNVPISGTTSYQYVMNVLNGSWCRFIGMNALHWTNLADNIYWGGVDGEIRLFDEGVTDAGVEYEATCITRYDAMGAQGRIKHCMSGQAFYQADSEASISIGFAADFAGLTGDVASTSPSDPSESGAGIWDTGLWDTAVWSADINDVQVQRVTGSAVGYMIGVVVTANTGSFEENATADLRFTSINVLYEAGDIVG